MNNDNLVKMCNVASPMVLGTAIITNLCSVKFSEVPTIVDNNNNIDF